MTCGHEMTDADMATLKATWAQHRTTCGAQCRCGIFWNPVQKRAVIYSDAFADCTPVRYQFEVPDDMRA